MYRDAIIIDIGDGKHLVTTCDSCGSIGQKENDFFKVSPDMVGFLTARVALMEAMSLNATPSSMIIPIANEPEPTASIILSGIKRSIDELKMDIPLLISTEKNMPTSMTAFGVVVNAISSSLWLELPKNNDLIYMVGVPSVGEEVLNNENSILNPDIIQQLLSQNQIRQIIPAGSGGIIAEVDEIVSYMRDKICDYNMELILYDANSHILSKSCGPATAALVFAPYLDEEKIDVPISKIGHVIASK